jgi:regulator of RNase E activity RraA
MAVVVRFLVWLTLPGTALAQSSITSSDVADAVERLSARRAHLSAHFHRLAGDRMIGSAVTLQLVREEGASSTGEGLKAIQVLERAAPGSVIVVCSDGNPDFAVFGPTFATLAKARGLAGFVIDGGMRGVSDLRKIGVPVFARSAVPGSAGGHYRMAAVNERVSCDGVEIAPGDMVVADDDGVAIVPANLREEALARAQALRDEKEALLPLIARYGSYTRALQEYRATRSSKP